jgi:excisionase family DNA binding protein
MEELYSVEQVAQRLGLHVRTVRTYVREGRLKAVRIGKQYRIAAEDLDALTGRPATDPVRTARHIEVSAIVTVDAISRTDADRLSTLLTAAVAGPPTGDPVRVQTVYEEERGRLKVVVLGDLTAATELLGLVSLVTTDERPPKGASK